MINNKKGMSLIVLVITILVMIILAGVVVMGLVDNNPITKAIDARTLTNLKSIESDIYLYMTKNLSLSKKGLDLFPIRRDELGKPISADDYYDESFKNNLSEEAKETIKRLQLPYDSGLDSEIRDEEINFDYFYVLDTDKVQSAKAYKDKYLMLILGDEYLLIHLDGMKYEGTKRYIALPIRRDINVEFITGTQNIFKLYTNGDLKAIGKKSEISGDEDMDVYSGVKDIDYLERFPGYKELAIDENSALLIDANDELYGWGANTNNKFGLGNNFLKYEPVKLLGGKKVKHVWTGELNTYVLTLNGELWACGANESGGLGQGNRNTYKGFVRVFGIPDPSKITNIIPSKNRESDNAVIICESNGIKTVYGIGANDYDVFTSANEDLLTVKDITPNFPGMANAQQIGFSAQNLIYRVGTTLYGLGRGGYWGKMPLSSNTSTPSIIATGVAKISDEGNTTIYIGTDGYVYKCNNIYSSSVEGKKVTQEYLRAPTYIGQSAEISEQGHVYNGNKIYWIKLGSSKHDVTLEEITTYENVEKFISEGIKGHVVFKSTDGKIYVDNVWQVTRPYSRIQLDANLIKEDIKYVSADDAEISLVDKDNKLWTSLTTKYDKLDSNVVSISTNDTGSIIVTEDGKVYRKGSKYYGGTGRIENITEYKELIDANFDSFDNVKMAHILSNEYQSVFVTEDNKLYYTGYFWYPILPNANINADTGSEAEVIDHITMHPTRVSSPAIDSIMPKFKDIKLTFTSIGGSYRRHAYILTTDGEVWSYGTQYTNGLGSKTTTDFEKVSLPSKVRYIRAEEAYCMALLDNGDVYAWGYNTEGQFGTGKNIGSIYTVPVKLSLPGKVMEFGLGKGFSIFGLLDGKVYGSGRNEYGQLGTGDTLSRTSFDRCPNLEEDLGTDSENEQN